MDPDRTLPPVPTPPSGQDTIATQASDGAHSRHPTADPDEVEVEDPDRIGRFLVIERLGAGGMGVVYAAFDPKLERKIAVKLVRPRSNDASGGQDRLLREAQAMAKLSDPNVIQVFDVGTHGERVYIAMEFVKGTTLRKWLLRGVEGTRPLSEILDVFGRAGRGLMAAHQAGLVHRDFKPDNVLVGSDGRVRVSDFGLVRAEDGEAVPVDVRRTLERTGAHASLGQEGLGVSLTQTGALMGTPAYMAPEQFAGGEVDTRTDQFAYCVSLWEALYGERPFAGRTAPELLYAVTQGKVRDPPRNSHVPARLQRVLRRGLAVQPDERYATMAELLAELERDPGRATRRVTVGAVLVGALGLGLWAVNPAAEPEDTRCQGFSQALEGTWDDARRGEIEAAIRDTKVPYADTVWKSVSETLDFYAAAWVDMKTDTCQATQIRGEQSERLMDLRMACLDRRKQGLAAAVDVLAQADASTVSNAVRLVRSLEPLADCADTETLTAAMPLPSDPDRRAKAEALEAKLDRVRAMYLAGQYGPGLELANDADTDARALAHPPLEAQAAYFLGSLLASTGKFQDADPQFRRGYWRALAGHNDQVMARSASAAAWNLGANLRKDDVADDWISTAEAAVQRWGLGTEEEARYLNQMGTLYARRGEHERAFELHKRGLAVREEAMGKDSFMLGVDHLSLGVTYNAFGEDEAAWTEHLEALSILEPALGREHPWTSILYQNLGQIALDRGDQERALKYAEIGLEIKKATVGEEHPDTGGTHAALARVLMAQGDEARARPHLEKALAIREKGLGPEHPDVAKTLVVMGDLLAREGDLESARAHYARARAIYEKVDGKREGFADALHTEAVSLRLMGRPKDAVELHERALMIIEAASGPDHPQWAAIAYERALTMGELGELDEALESVERALKIFEDKKRDYDAARAKLVLAHLLTAKGVPDDGRARALREQGEAGLAERRTVGQREREKIDAWAKGLSAG